MAASLWAVARPRVGTIAMASAIRALLVAAGSIPMNYCASVNTSPMDAYHATWQSDGLCHDYCNGQYALAIINGDACWCSDYLPDPSTLVSTDKCNSKCPGFPQDVCGGNGLFGYMALNKAIAGTQVGSATPSATASPTSKSSVLVKTETEIVQNTVVNTVTFNSQIRTTTSDPETTITPTPSVLTVTADGTIKTVTVTPTIAVNSPSSANITSGSSSGLSTGAAVGIAVVVVVIVAALIGALACFFIKRKRRQRAEDEVDQQVTSTRSSSAGMSSLSKPGTAAMGFAGGQALGQNRSMGQLNRKNSHLMPVDPRMDSFNHSIYAREGNRSHESFNSLRDDQDYSRRVHESPRVLRTTNPDPDDA